MASKTCDEMCIQRGRRNKGDTCCWREEVREQIVREKDTLSIVQKQYGEKIGTCLKHKEQSTEKEIGEGEQDY